jgi:hypothetical protein
MMVAKNCSLKNYRVSDTGSSAVARALCGNNVLMKLFLSGNGIGSSDAVAPAETLHTHSWKMYSIDNDGAVALADAQKINTTPAKLTLGYIYIGDEGAMALLNTLKGCNATIASLKLADSNLSSTAPSTS